MTSTISPRRLAPRLALVALAAVAASLLAGSLSVLGSAAAPSAPVVASISGLVLLGAVLAFSREQARRVVMDDRGVKLVELGLGGIETTAIGYAEIDGVFIGATRTTRTNGIVEAINGDSSGEALDDHTAAIEVRIDAGGAQPRTIKLQHWDRAALTCYALAVQRSNERLLTASRRALEMGRSIDFGALQLDANVAHVNGVAIECSRIDAVTIAGGRLHVDVTGRKRLQARVRDVKNLEVALAVLAEMRGVARSVPLSPTRAWRE